MSKQQQRNGNGGNIIDMAQRRNFQQLQRLEAVSDLLSDARILFGDTSVLLVPGWGEAFQGVSSEIQLPDGSSMVIFTNSPIPEGLGIMLTSDGENSFRCQLAALARDSNGQEIAFTPLEEPVMVIPDPDDDE